VRRALPLPVYALGIVCVLAAGCGKSSSEQTANGGCSESEQTTHTRTAENEHLKLDPTKTYRLIFDTNCGDFTVTLSPRLAPNATGSLVSLARKGFFDDTFFHRVVPGFVIQGGDPSGTGSGGPGYVTHDSVPKNASYAHGVVAMAKAANEPAGTAGSQFFVVTAKDAGLPPDYAVVGKVTSGLDVVDRIGELGDAEEHPTQPIVIDHVDVKTS
jgi:cyclophilin family peptidyl-prolyl cis-trans isomerase